MIRKLKGFRYLLLLALIFILVVGCSSGKDEDTSTDTSDDNDKTESTGAPLSGAFATGSSGGAYNVLGGGILKVISDNTDNINLNATTPPSVSQTPLALSEGQAVLGIAMVDMIQRAENGEGEFDEELDNLAPVLAMYDNVMSVIVLEDSSVTNYNELEGLKIGVASESSKDAMAAFIEATGVDESTIRWEYLPYGEMTEAIKDGNIDAGVYTSFPRNGLLEELEGTHGIRFLEIDDADREKFDEEYPLWASSAVPSDTYPGMDKDAYGLSYFTALYSNYDVAEEHIYEITKAILENNDAITEVHPAGEYITLEKMEEYVERNILIPDKLHPGAKKYFEEQGVIE